MRSKLLHEVAGQKTYMLVFDTGDEVATALTEFARENRVGAGHFSAIGAFQTATLAFFDWNAREYKPIDVSEQVEVVSLNGDIAIDEDGAPKVHAHAVLGKRDGTAICGHLMNGIVRPTLELTLVDSPQRLQRRPDAESGLALIRL